MILFLSFNQKEVIMDGNTTVKYLQNYIRAKDFQPDLVKDYFIKLSEEVGELARAIRKGICMGDSQEIKGTVDEEIWDVIYYALAIANCYGIDVESVIKEKERINKIKYNYDIAFEENR